MNKFRYLDEDKIVDQIVVNWWDTYFSQGQRDLTQLAREAYRKGLEDQKKWWKDYSGDLEAYGGVDEF